MSQSNTSSFARHVIENRTQNGPLPAEPNAPRNSSKRSPEECLLDTLLKTIKETPPPSQQQQQQQQQEQYEHYQRASYLCELNAALTTSTDMCFLWCMRTETESGRMKLADFWNLPDGSRIQQRFELLMGQEVMSSMVYLHELRMIEDAKKEARIALETDVIKVHQLLYDMNQVAAVNAGDSVCYTVHDLIRVAYEK